MWWASLIPIAIGAGLAYYNSKKGSGTQVTEESYPSTPVKVRLKSGNIVTMYAHGPKKQTTKTEGGANPALTALSNAAMTYGASGMRQAGGQSVPDQPASGMSLGDGYQTPYATQFNDPTYRKSLAELFAGR